MAPRSATAVGERTLSSGVTAIVFSVARVDGTVQRHYGYDELTGRIALVHTRMTETGHGQTITTELFQELVPAGSTTASPGTGRESCREYLDLLVSSGEGIRGERAVVTSYQCMSMHVDSTAQYPSKTPSFAIAPGVPLSLSLGVKQKPVALELRLYSGAGISGAFGRWPEELYIDKGPVDTLQPTPSLKFQYLPQQQPGEYSLVVKATWNGPVDVFYAVSFKLG